MSKFILFEDDDMDFDIGDLDTDDDLDMDDYNLDTIDDSSEVDNAHQITLLKKKAGDLAKKWQETYKQISDLARKLDLTVSHNDDLEIELKKSDGNDADIEGDLDDIEAEMSNEESEDEETDDDFGPSKYDKRANDLAKRDDEIKRQPLAKSKYLNDEPADPNELPLDAADVDDDF